MLDNNTADDSRDEDYEDLFNGFADEANIVDEVVKDNVDHHDSDDIITDNEIDDNTEDETQLLKQQLEVLRKERDDFEHSFKSQVGRVSALQKKLDSEVPAAKKLDDELASAMEDYPEIVKPMIDYFERKYGDIDQRLTPIQQQNDRQDEQRYIDTQLSIINTSIPDWQTVIAGEDYKNWLGEQPAAIQSMASSYDARDYQYLIGSFQGTKTKSNELAQRRQNKLANNVAVQSKGVSKSSAAPDDYNAAWEYYASKKK
jgi:DNA repair exonuclease SbcCD ATPase subunit